MAFFYRSSLFFGLSLCCMFSAQAQNKCSDSAVMTDKINKLRAQVLCSASSNISDCAKLLGYQPSSVFEQKGALSAAALAGGRAASKKALKALTAPAPPPDLKTVGGASPERVARDEMFRKYVGSMPPLHAANVSYEKLVELGKNRPVIVLGGYSGQGYEDPVKLREYIKNLMRQAGDKALFVIGGTDDGIGNAYKWIPEIAEELKLKGVETAGIVSRNAAKYGVAKQNYIVFVDTAVDSWEVKKGSESLMVSMAKDTNGQLAYFRGGEVSRAEIKEALQRGVPVNLARSSELSASQAVAAKKIAKANPGMSADSPEFKALLKKAMDDADKPTAELMKEMGNHPKLKSVDAANMFKNVAPRTSVLESLGLKKLLSAEIAKSGLKFLASPYLMAAELTLHSTNVGCAEVVDLYLERDKENGCRAYPSITPKFIEFLNMDEAQQEKLLTEVPAFCEQANKLYDQYIENAKLSGVQCSSEGFSIPKKFSVKTDSTHRVVEISGDPQKRNFGSVESVHFDTSGNPKEICYRGARGESCKNKYSIETVSPDAIKFNSTEDLSSVEYNTLNMMNVYRSNYLAILETASCCSQDGDLSRCKKSGSDHGAPSNKSNQGSQKKPPIEGVN